MTKTNNYWEKKWENNDIYFHDDSVNQLLVQYLPRLNLNIGDTILVPLCGKSIDMIWLAKQGFKVIGIELSPIACKDFFSSQNMTPTIISNEFFTIYEYENIQLYCGDIFHIQRKDLQPISAIYDWKALIALPSDLRARYIKHLSLFTNSQINLLLITMESYQEVNGPPFSITDAEINSYFAEYIQVEKVNEELLNPVPKHLKIKGWMSGARKVYIIQQMNT